MANYAKAQRSVKKRRKVGTSRQTFTDEQKSAALALLIENRRDYTRTAKATNVPEKLLRAWAHGRGVSREVCLQFVGKSLAMLKELRETLPPPFGVTKLATPPKNL